MSLHVYAPAVTWTRHIMFCPVCEARRRFVAFRAEWYNPTFTCCACGDSFDPDEGRYPRPFARGWREEAIRGAKKRWNTIGASS